jgi:hypothetical protein
MARKMKSRRHSRKHMKKLTHKRRNRRNNRRTNRRQKGGVAPLSTAYADMATWQSKMSLGQGDDFATYHKAQHGGVAPYPGMVTGSMLPADMLDSARTSGTMDALRFAQQFRDPPYAQAIPTPSKVGGKRKSKKTRKGRKHRGGALEGAPVTMNPMLLPNQAAYGAAGLNPEYRGAATEYSVAKMRDSM